MPVVPEPTEVIVRVQAREIHDNPTPEQLRAFTEEMPQCRVSTFGNVNVQTRVVSRSAGCVSSR